MMCRRLISLLLAFFLGGAAPGWGQERPIVAELFTSQGCSSCPAAEALLAELATQAGLLPLAMHIDYWDDLGWKDPFSSRAATARQRAYDAELGVRGVYTPQMVVDGHWQAVGSDRRAVAGALAAADRHRSTVPLHLAVAPGMARITIGPGGPDDAATVWLVGFDRRHETKVRAGENAGRTLIQVSVVRGLAPVGHFAGGATEIEAPIPWRSDRIAALLQRPDGRVVGAAVADAP
jgi:hypothetical protein